MQIVENLFGPQSRNLERSLNRATTRHALLSENLANVNVPNYKRRDIEFGIELEKAETSTKLPLEKLHNHLSNRPHTDQGAIRVDGSSVDLEQEIVGLGETETRYELLSEMTSRFFGGLKSVIREGK